MNITTYFIKHPISALVLNALIIIIGLLCFKSLSLREYPALPLAKVVVFTQYPNASAQVVEQQITNVLESRLAGLEGLNFMRSHSFSGRSNISLDFNSGIEMDKALSAVREAISRVSLPLDASPPLVLRKKAADSLPFMLLSLESEGTEPLPDLTHYASLHLNSIFKNIAT